MAGLCKIFSCRIDGLTFLFIVLFMFSRKPDWGDVQSCCTPKVFSFSTGYLDRLQVPDDPVCASSSGDDSRPDEDQDSRTRIPSDPTCHSGDELEQHSGAALDDDMSNPVCDSEADSIPICNSEVEGDNVSFANSDDLNWLKIDVATPIAEDGGLSRDNTLVARDGPSRGGTLVARVSCFI